MCSVQPQIHWGGLQSSRGGMSWQHTPTLTRRHALPHTQVRRGDACVLTAGGATRGGNADFLSHTPVAGVLSRPPVLSASRQLHDRANATRKVRPSPEFLKLLRCVGAKGDVFTRKELCVLLRDYIVAKELYDENDPRIVYCANDALGQVFGLLNFTIADVMTLLQANCTTVSSMTETSLEPKINSSLVSESSAVMHDPERGSVQRTDSESTKIPAPQAAISSSTSQEPKLNSVQSPRTSYSHDRVALTLKDVSCSNAPLRGDNQSKSVMDSVRQSPRKRVAETELEDSGVDCKMQRRHDRDCPSLDLACDERIGNVYPWYRRRGEANESDDSEVLSVQSKETEYVKDSSDDLWFVDDEEDEEEDAEEEDKNSVFSLEYEVESDVSDACDNDQEQDLSHTDESEEEVVEEKAQDAEMDFWADSSDISSDESEVEIPKQDSWYCRECGTMNRPIERHCGRCWKLRPGWLTTTQRQFSRSRKSAFAASSSRGYNNSDDSDCDSAPWLPVEKALHKLRSTCQVSDDESDPNCLTSPVSSQQQQQQQQQQNQQQQQQSVASLSVPKLSASQTLPVALPVSDSSSLQKQSATVCMNSNPSTLSRPEARSSPKKSSTLLLSSNASPIVCTRPSTFTCAVPRSSAVTSTATLSSLQRSSTPLMNSEFNTRDLCSVSPCNLLSSSDISYNQSTEESPASSQGEACSGKSRDASRLLQQCDSGISGLDSHISEGPSFQNPCSESVLSSLSTKTKSHSAPTTPVKQSSASANSFLLTPTKKTSVLEKLKALPQVAATRRTLSHYQIATPSSGSSATLRHCSSAPVISTIAMPQLVKSSEPTAGSSATVSTSNVNRGNNVHTEIHADAVKPSDGVSTGTQTGREHLPVVSHAPSTSGLGRVERKDGPSSIEPADACMICLTKPKEASIIHGKTGHQVCCYSCAKRLRRRGKPCPVCRRPIHRVIKNYVM